jgi:hypothetical protein
MYCRLVVCRRDPDRRDDLAVDLARGVVDEGIIGGSPSKSYSERVVDILVRDFRKRRLESDARFDFRFHLLSGGPRPSREAIDALHAQADETERGTVVEDHHQDDPPDDRDVDVVLLPFVEGMNSFSPIRREAVGGGDVAGGQGRQRRGVDRLEVSVGRNLLTVLVVGTRFSHSPPPGDAK